MQFWETFVNEILYKETFICDLNVSMRKMELHKQTWRANFQKWAKRHLDVHGSITIFAKKAGTSRATISNLISGMKYASEENMRRISAAMGKTYEEMIVKNNKTIGNISLNETTDKENLEHFDIVKRFEDKITALEINKALLQIEDKDPVTGLKRILKLVQGELEFLGESNAQKGGRKTGTEE